ncbi:MAG: 4-hydroxy-3-methylbut-2-enyl diphosphate reductase [Candidatus Omnitrophica bacterium]|nr:4-hydroxy-3-methylbut-2-enyl diphosphate reductase [Candidatus Omnitrophota bacterium]
MKVNLAKSAGFCFGVKRAIEIAKKVASNNKKVFIFGEIVHNEQVSQKLYKLGIRKLERLKNGKEKILLIRAHGVGKNILKRAREEGYKIVDATCPMVKEIHKIAKEEEKRERKIIVVGDKNHDEVLGIIGQLKTAPIVIDPKEKIGIRKIRKINRASVVVQSTQDIEQIEKIRGIMEKYIKDLKFFNTVCKPTRIKQEEIKTLPRENDLVLIIGSSTSANTKRLYEIAKKINKNTFWINNKKDIKPEWFQGINSIGVTAGASTPEETIREVVDFVRKLN